MIAAFELAGFFAAHSIWCVSDDDGLAPIVAFQTADGARRMNRIDLDDLVDAVNHGRALLESTSVRTGDGVLVYDGRYTFQNGKKVDAIILEIRTYAVPMSRAAMAVAYTPQSTGKFRVHKPKLIGWEHCESFDLDAALESFFIGVASHEQGAKVWNDALDESI